MTLSLAATQTFAHQKGTTKWRVRFYQIVKTHSLISVHIQFVSQGYDTTPICNNQFILETSAFSLSFWYAILTENRKGWGQYGRPREMGTKPGRN